MMSVQLGSIRYGIALQADRDTPAAAPQFLFGVAKGSLVGELTKDKDELTSASSTYDSIYVSERQVGFALETRAWPGSIGLLLHAALGVEAVTGSGPYTHVNTHGRPLPYLSVFEIHADGTAYRVSGAKLDELEFSWSGNEPVAVTASGPGLVREKLVSAVAAEVDESGTKPFSPVGGLFKHSLTGAVPALAKLKGGNIKLANAVERENFSGTIDAGDVTEGFHEATGDITIVPEDRTGFDNLFANPESLGSSEIQFVQGSASLKFEAGKVSYTYPVWEGEGGGGKFEPTLSGEFLRPTGWSGPVRATVVNSIEDYEED